MNSLTTGSVFSVATLRDKTVKVVLHLNETTPKQTAGLISLVDQYVKVYMSTESILQDVKDAIDEQSVEVGGKSPSQRLRNVLHVLWEQDKQGYEDFNLFYRSRMDLLIEQIKNKLI